MTQKLKRTPVTPERVIELCRERIGHVPNLIRVTARPVGEYCWRVNYWTATQCRGDTVAGAEIPLSFFLTVIDGEILRSTPDLPPARAAEITEPLLETTA